MPEDPYVFKGRVLLISPDTTDHLALQRIVDQPEWTLLWTRDVAEGERILSAAPVAAVIVDFRCWKKLQMVAMEFPLIVFDRLADESLWTEVLSLGGCDLVSKPFEAKEVLRALRIACRRGTSLGSLSRRVHGCLEGQAVEDPEMESAALAHP